tara:strand:+ start:13792 stop:14451 length:660 start_codon:yes stop_codon:yes gene_type:complete
MSLGGLCPLSDKITNMSIADNTLKIIASSSKMIKYEFKKLHIFDDYNTTGLSPKTSSSQPILRVVDWFDVRSGMEHHHDRLESATDFVKEVIFYPSRRFGSQSGSRIRKDLVAVSYIPLSKMSDFEYSDTMVKFKVDAMMKKAGIKGARNGRDTNNPNKYKYYSVKIESVEREVDPAPLGIYLEDPRFEYLYHTPENILKTSLLPSNTYTSKILKIMLD